MSTESLDAWMGVVGVAVGALFTLAGGALSERGHRLRAERAEKTAQAARIELRRTELWQISLPAAGRIQELFATTIRLARRSLSPSLEPEPPFDEAFSEWWEEKEPELERDIALIPSLQFREAMTVASDGVSYGYGLTNRIGYAKSYEAAVIAIGQIGFDVPSAWMRDETTIDASVHDRVDDVRANLSDMHESYESDFQEFDDPKGYGIEKPTEPLLP